MSDAISVIPRGSILLVLGMHRSGTSFLAHCTEILGLNLPRDRGGPADDNPKGHFEPLAVVELNDRVMARTGAAWSRIGALPDGPDPAEMEAALTASFADDRNIVVKDPRMSLLMPGWAAHLDRAGTVSALIALRHPAEIAASLQRRDGLAADLVYLSWIAHTLAALDATTQMPRDLILFPDWMGDVDATLTRIAALCDREVPKDAAEQVRARFDDNAVHGGRQITAATPEIDTLGRDLFDLLAGHARAGTLPASADLAPYRTRFDALSASARATEEGNAFHIRRLASDVDHLSGEMARYKSEAASFAADGAALQAQVAGLETQLVAAADERTSLQDQLQASEQQRVVLGDALATQNEQLSHLTRLLEMERMTILKPIYRRLHRQGGHVLRRLLPQSAFDRLKRALPYPGGVPAYLAYAPGQAPQGVARQFDKIAPAETGRPDIFVMSIINWDFRTQRPQHLAAELAALGHRVFFIEMEGDDSGGALREVAPNVYVVRLSARGLRAVKPYSGQVPDAAIRAWIDHFHSLSDQVGVTPRAHVVVEHPYWWNFVRHLSRQYQITFDCMDEIAGFSNTEQAILDLEADMIERADRMIVSSQYLFDKYGQTRDVALIRNGTDVSHFIREGDSSEVGPPDFLKGKLRDGAIRVGYVGAIAEWFHTELLEEVARDNPDFDIHLCGSVTAEAPVRLNDLDNVTMHGEIRYADVPGFLEAMDVLIIPFQLLPIIKACDPVKFYEYSAVRKPTVSTALPELERAGDLVVTAGTAAEFADGIRQSSAKADDPAHGDALRSYALENAWAYRAADMLAEMERAPLLSVVVLAYGAADLTLACLESLLDGGPTYPEMEVIVVDNGSPAEERARLREAAERAPQIRLIENGENLGFARGNNVGIEAAGGEYVLLLNNDTVVPPGALSAMVAHLERDAQIGIVGPMTNNIGNEARIEVAYGDMDAMRLVARDLVTGYRGVSTPIPVAAYFCAMFRKADLDRIGHLPTDYGRGMFEDDDHCASFRAAGMEIALAEDAFVHHHLSATFGALPSEEKQALFDANKAIFERKWGEWIPHRYRDSRPDPSLPDRA
ncbi:hypothetical protein SAMN05421538_106193 [Paracoccus isoporae]|uniref:Glycosyltransferase 2-like domain-containing protein n=1 Tax=Paracoccus isoporae TaxID=591205 RepID=A0A1G7CRZ5_9RHOB|nr:glycosyltransferase [Paracoccus isoporae]SDE42194.1 hypothetical protein SAMN05421538_106193 [Paracoccus isoporae]